MSDSSTTARPAAPEADVLDAFRTGAKTALAAVSRCLSLKPTHADLVVAHNALALALAIDKEAQK